MSNTLFPPIEPHRSGFLDLDDIHKMYWEESGNPKGVPVVFVHGGPGGGSPPQVRSFFDPSFYRIILFDQRGAGRSTPYAEIKNNTTPLLISDMEKLRKFLNVDKWYLFGGSWGTTLSLAYAEAFPESCRGLILRSIFLCRPSEIEWFLCGVQTVFPEANETFLSILKPEERKDWKTILKAYHALLTDDDPEVCLNAAKIWSGYEGTLATLLPNQALVEVFESEKMALAIARFETHYLLNDIFLPPNNILNKIDRIRHLPGYIVHGRYDMVCPIVSAYDLVKAWPEADFRIILDAGHSATEPNIKRELVQIMKEIQQLHNNHATSLHQVLERKA